MGTFEWDILHPEMGTFEWDSLNPEMGTFEWDILNPDQIINLEIKNEWRTSNI